MAKGSKSAVPATPMKSSGGRTEASDRSGDSFVTPQSSRMEPIPESSATYDDSVEYPDANYDEDAHDEEDDDDNLEEKGPFVAPPSSPEDATVSIGRSSGVRPLSRNLTDELNAVAGPEPAHDGEDVSTETPATAKAGGGRPRSTATGHHLTVILRLPTSNELATPVDSASTQQVARDTVILLRSMGCEPQKHPSDAVLRDWTPSNAGTVLMKWKRKLRMAFGTPDIGAGRQPVARDAPEAEDPSKIPLPQTTRKTAVEEDEGKAAGVFSVSTEASPYYHDSHMVTPRSASRSERLARDTEDSHHRVDRRRGSQRPRSKRYEFSEDSSSDDDLLRELEYDDSDLTEQWKAPDSRAERVRGVRRTTPSRNCDTSAAREHQTLLRPSLEQRLRYVRVKDIHDLVDLINEILLSEERSRAIRETSSYRSKGREDSRRRDARRTEESRGAYRRDRRGRDLRDTEYNHPRADRGLGRSRSDNNRDDARYQSRITLVEALTNALTNLDTRTPGRHRARFDSVYSHVVVAVRRVPRCTTEVKTRPRSIATSQRIATTVISPQLMMRSVEQQQQVPTVGPTHGRGVTETGRCQSETTDASDGMAGGPSPSMDPVQRVVGVTTQRTTASVGAKSADKSMMLESARPSMRSPTWSETE
ncbi:unnamed protein product [Phytophthora lilii]|uniref:Unnamed protein product n=1 Tax=Phytophthora lilii TaxID=2077276 RepID=A0A9W6UB66_9STRA|nr:unnamed protein product [Phytophthora lilii]